MQQRSGRSRAAKVEIEDLGRAAPISARQRASWIVYAAVPASLLLGVTTFISTDIAAVPLLWVLPLSIYLLTFVIVFSSRPLVPHAWMVRAEPHVLVIIAVPIFWTLRLPGIIGIVAHLTVLFVVAMVCHGELARRRPPASQLTEFFVWVAVGGLVGGVFNALIAPVAFNRIYEYPIAPALAGILMPPRVGGRSYKPTDVVFPIVLGVGAFLLTMKMPPLPNPSALVVTMIFGVAIFSFGERPLRFGLALATLFVAGQLRGATTIGSTRTHSRCSSISRAAATRPKGTRRQSSATASQVTPSPRGSLSNAPRTPESGRCDARRGGDPRPLARRAAYALAVGHGCSADSAIVTAATACAPSHGQARNRQRTFRRHCLGK